MRTKEDVYDKMKGESPFVISDFYKPYILEAMEIYAKEYHKAKLSERQATEKADNPPTTEALSIGDVVSTLFCDTCKTYVTYWADLDRWTCNCGRTTKAK